MLCLVLEASETAIVSENNEEQLALVSPAMESDRPGSTSMWALLDLPPKRACGIRARCTK